MFNIYNFGKFNEDTYDGMCVNRHALVPAPQSADFFEEGLSLNICLDNLEASSPTYISNLDFLTFIMKFSMRIHMMTCV